MIITELRDFVGIFDDVVSPEFCKFACEHFEYAKDLSLVYTRQQNERIPSMLKKDETLFMIDNNPKELQVSNSNIYNEMSRILKHALDIYISEYSVLDQVEYGFFNYRIQKTQIGGGYHVWHHERGKRENESRFITAILYLNNVHSGGETEFLYYPKRVKPKAGRLILFPAEYTHAHRGNPPISNDKYIITTWGNYTK